MIYCEWGLTNFISLAVNILLSGGSESWPAYEVAKLVLCFSYSLGSEVEAPFIF